MKGRVNRMKIKKVLNNNVVWAENEHAKEIVVMAGGLLFKRKSEMRSMRQKLKKRL